MSKEEAGIYIKEQGQVQIIHNSHGVFYLHLLQTKQDEDGINIIDEDGVIQTCRFNVRKLNEKIRKKHNETQQ